MSYKIFRLQPTETVYSDISKKFPTQNLCIGPIFCDYNLLFSISTNNLSDFELGVTLKAVKRLLDTYLHCKYFTNSFSSNRVKRITTQYVLVLICHRVGLYSLRSLYL